MSIWIPMTVVALFGSIGGLANALLTENGFIKPHFQEEGEEPKKVRVWRPGVLGNMAIGLVAAVISWGLYGPLASEYLVGGPASESSVEVGLTLSAAVGALLVGAGGARWLSNEVDKKLLQNAAAGAMSATASDSVASQIALASPAEALRIAFRE